MTISVGTWYFSALKFQADMGILLAFMFLVNVFGAILLAPALAAYLVKDDRFAKGGTRPPRLEPSRPFRRAGDSA